MSLVTVLGSMGNGGRVPGKANVYGFGGIPPSLKEKKLKEAKHHQQHQQLHQQHQQHHQQHQQHHHQQQHHAGAKASPTTPTDTHSDTHSDTKKKEDVK
ncbi:ell-associated factor Eaf-like [Procambarus clarkii]|uniref:ell-associated factor Eaf-like n=1 Tax=Procambarus clarkii TaxID=6728 RepID=UPI0037436FA1